MDWISILKFKRINFSVCLFVSSSPKKKLSIQFVRKSLSLFVCVMFWFKFFFFMWINLLFLCFHNLIRWRKKFISSFFLWIPLFVILIHHKRKTITNICLLNLDRQCFVQKFFLFFSTKHETPSNWTTTTKTLKNGEIFYVFFLRHLLPFFSPEKNDVFCLSFHSCYLVCVWMCDNFIRWLSFYR